MKRYPKYKDSGVPWLGQVPAHWEIKRCKHYLRERNQRSIEGAETLLSVSEYFGVKPRAEAIDEGDVLVRAKTLVDYKVCRIGDFVMNIMLAWKRAYGVTRYEGIVSPAYAVFRFTSDQVTPEYLHYLLRTDLYADEFKRNSSGVIDSRLRLYPEEFFRVPLLVPPSSEQQAVAKFLDDVTAKMDSAIASQERMIELLKERRSAIITQAVTKGLDPKAKMKDSGVPWLGQIPAHWQIRKLKTLSSGIRGGDWGDEPAGDMNDMYCIRAADLVTEIQSVDQSSLVLRNYPRGLNKSRILSPGDIIIEKSGGGDLVPVGRTAMVTDGVRATFSNFMGAIKPSPDVFSGFLSLIYYVMHDTGRVLRYIKQTTGIQNLDSQMLMSENIALPPFHEQIEIYEYVVLVRKQIEQAEKSMKALISLMKERRAAIITQAVTGQIDVR